MTDGLEEGDGCFIDECDGVMAFDDVTGCTCHINPPCNQCVENPLVCGQCGETEDYPPYSLDQVNGDEVSK